MIRPRTIRGQLIAGLLVFEILLVAVFAFFIVREHHREVLTRERRRLEYQAAMLSLLAQDAISSGRADLLQKTIAAMMQAPSISAVQITDMQGKTLLSSNPALNGTTNLTAIERRYLGISTANAIFKGALGRTQAVAPVVIDGRPKALCWVYPAQDTGTTELISQLQLTIGFAVVGALGCVLLGEFLARSVTRPLARLLTATRRIIRDPVDTSTLPPDSSASSEVADLTLAFNLMVAAIEEQRAGLNDTLNLLDSMLANAPIGMAFCDDHARFIRMNAFFADMNDLSVSKHIGRKVAEIFPGPNGQFLESGIRSVFASSEAERDLELTSDKKDQDGHASTWLVNIYPVNTATRGVRWVGIVVVDTTGIKRTEDALRRTEKLAAVGRLSASIAHEINNPLEAITNLLYLIRQLQGLSGQAAIYAEQAQHEVARMSEIVQQTLRFHRQSTRRSVANIPEILESVLSLHRGKVLGQQVQIERRYRHDAELYCFSGEMRQLFANFIGNALDAMPTQRGRLVLSVRYSRSWRDPAVTGIRIMIADTGYGMSAATQRRIFEPFFTTKEATGTGLGLWVSAEIIQKHQGVVRVRSRVGGDGSQAAGTAFMLFLPSQTPETRGRVTAQADAISSV